MQAPLGRAVIGGLVMSTFATLLVVPSIFAVVIGRKDGPLTVDLPGRPRKLALRPAGFHRRGQVRRRSPSPGGPAGPVSPATRRKQPGPGRRPRAGVRTRRAPEGTPLAWRSLMRRALRPTVSDRSAGCRRLVFWLLAALAASGCGGEPKINYTSVSKPPTVRLIQPEVRKIVRVVRPPDPAGGATARGGLGASGPPPRGSAPRASPPWSSAS